MFRVPQLLAASEQHDGLLCAVGIALILFFVAFFAAKSCWGDFLADTFWIGGGLTSAIASLFIASLVFGSLGLLGRDAVFQYSHSMLVCFTPQAGMLAGVAWAIIQKWLKYMEGDEFVPLE